MIDSSFYLNSNKFYLCFLSDEALQEVSLSEAALIVVGVLLAVLFASSAYEIFLSRTFGGVGFKARIGESDDGLQHNFLSQVDSRY